MPAKSPLVARLQGRYGWPIVRFDDFYRDDPRAWRADAGVHPLVAPCRNGVTDLPIYDIGSSRAVGRATVTAEPGQLLLAEGIFAAEIGALAEADALAAAYCVHNGRWVTSWRRLVRDLAERAKPPWILWRRGLSLCSREPEIATRQVDLGAQPVSATEAMTAISALLGTPH